MDRIESMEVFARVVARQSFSAAARDLKMSQAVVSKHVRVMEEWLGARLLDRTTRRLNLTEIGAIVHAQCERILGDIGEIEQRSSALQNLPRGVLRIAAPVSFGVSNHLGAALADYLEKYPDVVVDVTLSDHFVDIVEEGFDVALRIGQLKDSSMMVRRLSPIRFILCASPAYVERHGMPQHPNDLLTHRCLCYELRTVPRLWRFSGPDGELTIRISGRFRANSGNLLYAGMLQGAGIGLAPSFMVGQDVAAGRLVSLLPDYKPIETELVAIYPPGQAPSAKVRSLIDFLAARFGPQPAWDR